MDAKPARQPKLGEKFRYHAPSEKGVERHSALSISFVQLAGLVEELTLDCRERALALTKLEESKFWASAAVARYDETR